MGSFDSDSDYFTADPSAWVKQVAYTFGSLELLFLAITSYQLRRLLVNGAKWRIRELFHVAVIMLSTIFFFLAPQLEFGALSQRQRLSGVIFAALNFLGDTLFYVLYTLLLIFWIELYISINGHTTKFFSRNKPWFIAFAVCLFLVYVGVVLLYIEIPWHYWNAAHVYSLLGMACLYVLNAFGFMYYGLRLILVLHRNTVITRGSNKSLKVGALALVCTLIFLGRAVMVFYSLGLSHGHTYSNQLQGRSFGAELYVVVLYYSVGELFAEAIMLFIFRQRPRTGLGLTLNGDHRDSSSIYDSSRRRRKTAPLLPKS